MPDSLPPKSPPAIGEVVTGPIPGSRRVYVECPARGFRVPFREIAVHPSAKEPPVTLYDASGPYTDPEAKVDIASGLARIRDAWVRARGDVEETEGRAIRPEDNGNVSDSHRVPQFPGRIRPLKAKAGAAVARMRPDKRARQPVRGGAGGIAGCCGGA